MPQETELADAFRELRAAWFYAHLYRRAHERDWESKASEKIRENQNEELKAIFDQQTEEIIQGVMRPVAPRCSAHVTDQLQSKQG